MILSFCDPVNGVKPRLALRLLLLSPCSWAPPGLQDRDENAAPSRSRAPGKGLVSQTTNAHRMLCAETTILLKMKFLCQKSLSGDPVSCCALLVSRDVHRMGGSRLVLCFMVLSIFYVLSLWAFPDGFPRAQLLPCLLWSSSSQSAQSKPATSACAESLHCSPSAAHLMSHEISSLNLCPGHFHFQSSWD